MKLSPSPDLVKRNLSAHSVVGLVVGALMYLVCLTGTVAVLAFEFERWEQPAPAEFMQYDEQVLQRALTGFLERVESVGETVFIVLPTAELPRIHVADENHEWFVEPDGSLGPAVAAPWTEMLKDLHISLHLPASVGIVIVSALGVMLLALIISGLLAHPRIFKDAFRLRSGGSRRLEMADLHNRLSVWGLPFHLMIALTGALFGLLGPLALVAATAYYGGDQDALVADVYGADLVVDEAVQPLQIGTALAHLRQTEPDAEPIFLMIQQPGTRGQLLEVAARVPGRLIYSEIYQYGADGSYLGHQGFSDGIAGRQAIYSIYRVHFGQFGGGAVKVLYLLLGLALTVVSVSGVNIWLARRGGRDWINALWCGTVWGLPLALVVAALQGLIIGMNPLGGFVLVWLVAMVLCLRVADENRSARILQYSCAAALLLLLLDYYIVHADYFGLPGNLTINVGLLILAGVFGVLAYRRGASAVS
jgi:uncharacterized iron-regulated membrane protein